MENQAQFEEAGYLAPDSSKRINEQRGRGFGLLMKRYHGCGIAGGQDSIDKPSRKISKDVSLS